MPGGRRYRPRVLFIRKWSRRSKAFAVLALASGALAFRIVEGYAGDLEALRPIAGDPVAVVVAARDLTRGTAIDDGAVRVRTMPSGFAPPGAVGAPEGAVGRTLVSDVAEGEPITATRLAVDGGPVASLVPSGLRAFPIRAQVPGGSLRAGDLVDVLATFGGPHPYTETVADGLEVLAIAEGTEAIGGPGGEASLLVLVDPDAAERLAYATAYADLAVAIAPPG